MLISGTQPEVGCLVDDFKRGLESVSLDYKLLSNKKVLRDIIDDCRWNKAKVVIALIDEPNALDRHLIVYYNNGKEEYLLNDANKPVKIPSLRLLRKRLKTIKQALVIHE